MRPGRVRATLRFRRTGTVGLQGSREVVYTENCFLCPRADGWPPRFVEGREGKSQVVQGQSRQSKDTYSKKKGRREQRKRDRM